MRLDEIDDGGIATAEPKQKRKIEQPKLYVAVLHNDDYTPMDLVVYLLTNVFGLAKAEADKVMMQVHEKGKGIAGKFTKDIAETKVKMAMDTAKKYESPLLITVEKE